MVEEKVIMSQKEYKDLKIKKSKLKEKLKAEIYDDVYKNNYFPTAMNLIIFFFFFPKLIQGYNLFPGIITITVIIAGSFYIFSIIMFFLTVRNLYILNKEK